MRTKVCLASVVAALAVLIPVATLSTPPVGSPPASRVAICTPAWGSILPGICI